MTEFYMMFLSCYILLLLIIMGEIIGNNATEFPETNDSKRRDVPIISVNKTPDADSTENFPTMKPGKAIEDMEQTRVKIGVNKMLELVSGMLSHDKEFHEIDLSEVNENLNRNLNLNLTINDDTTTEDMEKYRFNTTENMEEPKIKFSDVYERFPGTIKWIIGIVAVFVLLAVFGLILQIRACKHSGSFKPFC